MGTPAEQGHSWCVNCVTTTRTEKCPNYVCYHALLTSHIAWFRACLPGKPLGTVNSIEQFHLWPHPHDLQGICVTRHSRVVSALTFSTTFFSLPLTRAGPASLTELEGLRSPVRSSRREGVAGTGTDTGGGGLPVSPSSSTSISMAHGGQTGQVEAKKSWIAIADIEIFPCSRKPPG